MIWLNPLNKLRSHAMKDHKNHEWLNFIWINDHMLHMWMNYEQLNVKYENIMIVTHWTLNLSFSCHENTYWLLISFYIPILLLNFEMSLNHWTIKPFLGFIELLNPLWVLLNHWILFGPYLTIELLNLWKKFDDLNLGPKMRKRLNIGFKQGNDLALGLNKGES